MTVDEFYKIVEPNIWSDDQINAYCNPIIQRIIQMMMVMIKVIIETILLLKEVKNIILHL